MPRKWRFHPRVIGWMVAAVGFGAAGFVQVADLYWLQHRGEVVTATVVDTEHTRRHTWIKVNYLTRDGRPVTDKTSNFHSAEVGETIDVRYDRENPHRMQAADYSLAYTFPLLAYGGFAVGLIVIGLVEVRFDLINRFRRQ
ncbi:DUF3592 domain-containing protein [Kribbella sp. NBC_01505]|uniref:DUF3592 domain-containing protein n=1 Tax=Kribbella sp. NBC_01505 TaxID=2903580 RepID=UPI00386B84A1